MNDRPSRDAGSRRSLKVVVAVVVVVAAVVGGWVGYRTWDTHRQTQAAIRAANELVTREPASDKALTDQIAAATKTAADIGDQVTDAGTSTALATALTDAHKAVAASTTKAADSLDLDAARGLVTANQRVLDGNTSAAKALKDAVTTATASHQAWLLDQATTKAADATQALADTITAAEARLAETDGQVDDNQVRQALRDALDKAATVRDATPDATLEAQDAQASAATDAKAAIDAAVGDVNTAVQARTDRIAAEQAAAAEAARQKAAANAKRSGTSKSSGGATGSRSTAPKSTTPQAPGKVFVPPDLTPRGTDSGMTPQCGMECVTL